MMPDPDPPVAPFPWDHSLEYYEEKCRLRIMALRAKHRCYGNAAPHHNSPLDLCAAQ